MSNFPMTEQAYQQMSVFPGESEKLGFPRLAEETHPADDPVNHPSHYTSGRFEVIDIIRDQLGLDGLRGFCLGNTIKYICRAGKKDPKKTRQDLEKAEWYLNHYLKESAADGNP